MINFKFKYYGRNLTFVLTFLFSPNEPVHFLGFLIFPSWIRADPDPKHWFEECFYYCTGITSIEQFYLCQIKFLRIIKYSLQICFFKLVKVSVNKSVGPCLAPKKIERKIGVGAAIK